MEDLHTLDLMSEEREYIYHAKNKGSIFQAKTIRESLMFMRDRKRDRKMWLRMKSKKEVFQRLSQGAKKRPVMKTLQNH